MEQFINLIEFRQAIYEHGLTQAGDAQWDQLMAVDLKGVLYCSREAVPILRQGGDGTIVNVASEAGLVAIPGQIAYNASKNAVIMLAKSMAVDHAAGSIRVNCICPGTTETPLVREALARAPDPQAARRNLESSRPLDRLGRSEEIAEGILYLASDASPYATEGGAFGGWGYTAQWTATGSVNEVMPRATPQAVGSTTWAGSPS